MIQLGVLPVKKHVAIDHTSKEDRHYAATDEVCCIAHPHVARTDQGGVLLCLNPSCHRDGRVPIEDENQVRHDATGKNPSKHSDPGPISVELVVDPGDSSAEAIRCTETSEH